MGLRAREYVHWSTKDGNTPEDYAKRRVRRSRRSSHKLLNTLRCCANAARIAIRDAAREATASWYLEFPAKRSERGAQTMEANA